MRVGGVTFLLGLALIHVSLADDIEKESTTLADGVVFQEGYIFDADEIFAEKADSLMKYSAEVMKECTTEECRHYMNCTKEGDDIICFDVRLINTTNLEELEVPPTLKSAAKFKDGYIFDNDEVFAEKVDSLLQYSLPVMKECNTSDHRYYTYCTKVGYNIVCFSIKLKKSIDEELDTAGHFVTDGHIFDDDEIFAEKSKSLLKYSATVMETCTTKDCRYYTFCNKVGYDVVCLSVWLSSPEELMNIEEGNNFSDLNDELNDVDETDNEGFFNSQVVDNDDLSEEKDNDDEPETESMKNLEEDVEKQKEDLPEDEVEDTPLV